MTVRFFPPDQGYHYRELLLLSVPLWYRYCIKEEAAAEQGKGSETTTIDTDRPPTKLSLVFNSPLVCVREKPEFSIHTHPTTHQT
jgi:hypothetical protein